MQGRLCLQPVFVVSNLATPAILGIDFIPAHGLLYDGLSRTVQFPVQFLTTNSPPRPGPTQPPRANIHTTLQRAYTWCFITPQAHNCKYRKHDVSLSKPHSACWPRGHPGGRQLQQCVTELLDCFIYRWCYFHSTEHERTSMFHHNSATYIDCVILAAPSVLSGWCGNSFDINAAVY